MNHRLIGTALGLLLALSLAAAEQSSSKADDESLGKQVADAARTVGHAARDATKAVGHATRDATKAVGHASRDVARDTGHAVANAAKDAKALVTSGDDKDKKKTDSAAKQ